MRRRVSEVHTASNQSGSGSLRVDCAQWEQALVHLEAVGAAGSALVLAAAPLGADNFTYNDGSAISAPSANTALVIGIGLGCAVGVPLPKELVVGLTATGGTVNLRVELFRWEEVDDMGEEGSFSSIRALLEEMSVSIRNLVDLLASRRR